MKILQVLPVFVLTFAPIAISSPAAAQRQPVVTAIDDTDRVTLKHTTHPLAQSGAAEFSAAEPATRMERMVLVLGPGDSMQADLRALIDSQHDRRSAQYHRWLTPEQFGERFGPSQQDVKAVAGWLQQKGFDNIKPARGRSHIEFSGSVQTVQQAFGTQMHYYVLNGQKHLANNSDLSIPRAMAGVVRGVNLQSFSFSKPMMAGAATVARSADGKYVRTVPQSPLNNGTTPDITVNTGNGTLNFLSPGDFANVYDLNPLYTNNINGSGSSIAIVERSNIFLSDAQTFRKLFGLPANDPTIVLNGQDPGQTLSNDLIEASVDTEWTGAVAPQADIKVVVSQSTLVTDGVLLSEAFIVENNLADIMSVSFGTCEQNLGAGNAFENALFQQAAAQGISVFVATGDSGAAGCDPSGFSGNPAAGGLAVSGFASTPFDTAVGGTEFNENGQTSTYWSPTNGANGVSVLGYIPEKVWNESCDGTTTDTNCVLQPPIPGLFGFDSTGGGASVIYSKPSWQSTSISGVPNDNRRDLPDVSLAGSIHDEYAFCVGLFGPCDEFTSGGQTSASFAVVGGTSVSAQAFAGIMALVDQKAGGRQGLANYVLYKLAAGETFANCKSSDRIDPTVPAPAGCIFNDVTAGNNGVPGNDTLSGLVPAGDTDGQVGFNALPGFDSASGLGSVDVTRLVNAWTSVQFLGSTTTLSEIGNTSAQHGQGIAFNVNVAPVSPGTGTPSGEFILLARNAPAAFDGQPVGSGILSNGAFIGQINTLPGGAYQVVAHYQGDGIFGASESGPVPVNVSQEPSSVTLNSGTGSNNQPINAPGPLSYGYNVGQPFQVIVSSPSGAGTPTGAVTLMDGGTALSTLPLSAGAQAVFVDCSPGANFCLGIGQHSITVVYSGDGSFAPSTSPAFQVTVAKGQLNFQSIVGCCSGGPNTPEFLIDLNSGVAIHSAMPTGTISWVDIFNGVTTNLATFSVSAQSVLYITLQGVGQHMIGVQYSGDSNYAPIPSDIDPLQTVPVSTSAITGKGVASQITLTPPLGPITEGQLVTFQVTVASASKSSKTVPTGTVFIGVGTDLFPGTLVQGTAAVQFQMPNGAFLAQATYLGDAHFGPSSSPVVNVITSLVSPALAMSSNATNVTAGTPVNLLAAFTPPTGLQLPQGQVQFFDSLNNGAPQPLGAIQQLFPANSNAGPPVSSAGISEVLPAGTNTITVSYTGDVNFLPIPQANSTSVTVTVSPGPLAVVSSATAAGGTLVTATNTQPASFITFLNSNGFVGDVALNCGGALQGAVCSVTPGSVELTQGVTSVPVTVTVTPASTNGFGSNQPITITLTGAAGATSSSIPVTVQIVK